MNKLDKIKEQLNHVPTTPGCYLWKNADGDVIYVGKAKQLRARMRQYVNFQDERDKIPLLVSEIDSFEYIVVENEHESLILEKNLIQQYKPYYNADFKDDKSYPFIAITKGDKFPAIKYTREKHIASTRYFGPYTDSRAARRTVDIVRRIVPICATSCATWRKLNKTGKFQASPCFDYHVGLGPGACCNCVSDEHYAENVAKVEKFLNGNQKEFLDNMESEMQDAADSLNFERAGRIKQNMDVVKSLTNKQHIVADNNLSADVIGFYVDEDIAAAHVLIVREGRVINSNEFILKPGLDMEHAFILKYYDTTTSIPKNIIIQYNFEDEKELSAWIGSKFLNPKRGEKVKLVEMATRNAKHTLLRYKVKTNHDDKRINKALLQLESALALDSSPMRIECYDISTIHGSYTVASMVVFTGGKPDKNQYRRFKIKTPLDEANDFLCMQEVLKRRFERLGDVRFGAKPDLIIVDGGKPQLTAAKEILGNEINIVGLAKRDEELITDWGEVVLPSGSESLYLVKQVRDEAHRFAITFHRELRGKGMTSSILDSVSGLGPVRRRALLKYFGSFKKLREATLDEIKDSHTIPEEVVEELYLVLKQNE
ncbi:MAG: excinuclease ABC subunit UvrC [Coriobacteriia bacterium]|nr:excinuclease ABC subunit UvrC [Coriobacteriia bacterium]